MSGAIDSVLQLLELAGLACALGLAILAIGGLLVSVAQVTLRGRVFVVPFRGVDSQRVDITILFASRLADIEARWIALAHEIQELRTTFGTTSRDASHGEAAHDVAEHDRAGDTTAASVSTRGPAPISSGRDPSALLATRQQGAPFRDVAGGPRTTGDEVLADMLLVAEQNSLADIDFGTLTVSGVSFSLQAFAALFRRLPGVFARRVLHGAISAMGTGSSLTVALEQRPFPGRYGRYRVGCTVHVQEDDWIAGVDAAAYGIAKARLDEFRTPPGSARAEASSSQTVAAAEIEAMSWSACEAFLDGYAAQLRHYLSGRASHRDEALDAYATALQLQPAYSRAAYNRATLLYNLYVPEANEEAIKLFEQATSSNDTRVRALAFAGLAMAYGQAIQRFEKSGGDLVSKAVDASQDALSLAPNLEEARFAAGWACQVQKDWDRAVAQYDSVVDLGATSAPGRRITSFALNNAGVDLDDGVRAPLARAREGRGVPVGGAPGVPEQGRVRQPRRDRETKPGVRGGGEALRCCARPRPVLRQRVERARNARGGARGSGGGPAPVEAGSPLDERRAASPPARAAPRGRPGVSPAAR